MGLKFTASAIQKWIDLSQSTYKDLWIYFSMISNFINFDNNQGTLKIFQLDILR